MSSLVSSLIELAVGTLALDYYYYANMLVGTVAVAGCMLQLQLTQASLQLAVDGHHEGWRMIAIMIADGISCGISIGDGKMTYYVVPLSSCVLSPACAIMAHPSMTWPP